MRLNLITKEKWAERERPRAEQLLGHQHKEVTCKGDQEGATDRAEGKPREDWALETREGSKPRIRVQGHDWQDQPWPGPGQAPRSPGVRRLNARGLWENGRRETGKKNNNNMQCFKELCCKETWRNRTAAGRMWSRAFVRMGDIERTSSWWQWWWVCTCFSCLTPCCISDLYVSSSDKASAITCPDICVLSPQVSLSQAFRGVFHGTRTVCCLSPLAPWSQASWAQELYVCFIYRSIPRARYTA